MLGPTRQRFDGWGLLSRCPFLIVYDINHLEDRLLSLHSARAVNNRATGTTNTPLPQNSRHTPR